MSPIPDLCETTGCPNLALGHQRYCTACLSRLVDGVTNPPPVALNTDSPTAEDLERAYVGIVYDAARKGDREAIIRRQQQVIREQRMLVENMEREIAYYQRQLGYAEDYIAGLTEQLRGLQRALEHNLALDATHPRTQNGGLTRRLARAVRRFFRS
jgi:hypothetical protein